MPKRTTSYHDRLLEDLQDPQEAAHYLNAVIEERSEPLFLLALRDIAESHQMSKVAKGAGVQRETIYRMLSETGNPRLSSLWKLFTTLGLNMMVQPSRPGSGRRGMRKRRPAAPRTDVGNRRAGNSPKRRRKESTDQK